MSGRSGAQVFIVSAYGPLRRALRELLEAEGIDVVGEGASAREGVDGIRALLPAVAILDERLPDGDALDVCSDLAQERVGTRCLVLTSWAPPHSADPWPGDPVFRTREIATIDLPGTVRKLAPEAGRPTGAHAPGPPPVRAGPAYETILAKLATMRGSGNLGLAARAEAWEAAVLRHHPTSRYTGSPCAGCGTPWPCKPLLDIVNGLD